MKPASRIIKVNRNNMYAYILMRVSLATSTVSRSLLGWRKISKHFAYSARMSSYLNTEKVLSLKSRYIVHNFRECGYVRRHFSQFRLITFTSHTFEPSFIMPIVRRSSSSGLVAAFRAFSYIDTLISATLSSSALVVFRFVRAVSGHRI